MRDGVDASHPLDLRGSIAGQPLRVVRARLGPRPPTVVGVVHVELREAAHRVGLVRHRGVDDLQHEHALARVSRHAHPAIADPELGVGHGHQRATAGVAEQHHRFRPSAHHLVVGRLHVEDAGLVKAIRVVAHVSGAEPEDGVAGRGQQGAGVMDGEVAAWVRQDHRRPPASPSGRQPEQSPHQCSVRADQPHRLARDVHTGIVLRQGPVAEAEGSSATQMDVEVEHRRSVIGPGRGGQAGTP